MKHLEKLRWVNAILVTALALSAFALSFEAIRDTAVKTGAVPKSLGWLFPALFDGAIICFSISALRNEMEGATTDMLRRLVIGATVASVFFNIAHHPMILDRYSDWLSLVMRATPPLLLFFSFETLVAQVKHSVFRGDETVAPDNVETFQPAVSPVETAQEPDDAATLQAMRQLRDQGMSIRKIAERVEMSASTVQRWLAMDNSMDKSYG